MAACAARRVEVAPGGRGRVKEGGECMRPARTRGTMHRCERRLPRNGRRDGRSQAGDPRCAARHPRANHAVGAKGEHAQGERRGMA
eukprot:362423-Chlamydomonas_euryale.AAC.4